MFRFVEYVVPFLNIPFYLRIRNVSQLNESTAFFSIFFHLLPL